MTTTCPAYEVQPPAQFTIGGEIYQVVTSYSGITAGDWYILAAAVDGPGSVFIRIYDDAPFTILEPR